MTNYPGLPRTVPDLALRVPCLGNSSFLGKPGCLVILASPLLQWPRPWCVAITEKWIFFLEKNCPHWVFKWFSFIIDDESQALWRWWEIWNNLILDAWLKDNLNSLSSFFFFLPFFKKRLVVPRRTCVYPCLVGIALTYKGVEAKEILKRWEKIMVYAHEFQSDRWM